MTRDTASGTSTGRLPGFRVPPRARYLLGRLGFVVFGAYLLLSITFLFVALTPDPNEVFVQAAAAIGGGDADAALDAYRSARNRNIPLSERYLTWLVGYSTFQWGVSRTLGDPVVSLIVEHIATSLFYVVPGLLLAAWGGLAVGMWTAIRPTSIPGKLLAGLGVVLGAIPSYWLGHLLILFAIYQLEMTHLFRWAEGGVMAGSNQVKMVGAALTIATALLVVQLRYVRSGTAEFTRTTAAKLVRAKGGRDRDVARHAVRLLGGSFLTLFLTESLTVLFLGMYVVETVFRIPGFGDLSLYAIDLRDIPLILGTTFVVVLFGLLGTLVEDVVSAYLDPRLDD